MIDFRVGWPWRRPQWDRIGLFFIEEGRPFLVIAPCLALLGAKGGQCSGLRLLLEAEHRPLETVNSGRQRLLLLILRLPRDLRCLSARLLPL